MAVYLDPRNDLVFKRIFGEHENILRSFLNALLPLEPGREIISLAYLPAEQVPQVPLLKNTIVDVRCQDLQGRQFIVEMQMIWTTTFMQRVLFNASKAYVRQLLKGEDYNLLQPVIGLSLLDDIFDKETPEHYHHYRMVEVGTPQRVIEGLELVFVELPKYPAGGPAPALKEVRRAWLRFLREAGDASDAGPEVAARLREDLAITPELEQAFDLAREAAFTRDQLYVYDRYWDAVSTERTLVSGRERDALQRGMKSGLEKGIAEGLEKGIAEGLEKGIAEGLEQGLAEGLERGRADGLLEALERLVAAGINQAEARRMLGLASQGD